jgi:hypothetical protein
MLNPLNLNARSSEDFSPTFIAHARKRMRLRNMLIRAVVLQNTSPE